MTLTSINMRVKLHFENYKTKHHTHTNTCSKQSQEVLVYAHIHVWLKPQLHYTELMVPIVYGNKSRKHPCGNLWLSTRAVDALCIFLQSSACNLECADCFEMFKTFAMIWHVKQMLNALCGICKVNQDGRRAFY